MLAEERAHVSRRVCLYETRYLLTQHWVDLRVLAEERANKTEQSPTSEHSQTENPDPPNGPYEVVVCSPL